MVIGATFSFNMANDSSTAPLWALLKPPYTDSSWPLHSSPHISFSLMASLSSVALSLAMAAIVSLVLALMVAPVAGQFSGLPPAQPQVPPCRAPSTTQSAALQDAVEGIAGLMQRFEDLQPQIAQLPATELQQIAQPAQKLHERFENMQKKLVALGSGNAGPELEEASWQSWSQ